MRKAKRTRVSSGFLMKAAKVGLNQQIARTARKARNVRDQFTTKVHSASEVYSCIVLLDEKRMSESLQMRGSESERELCISPS